jgi:hypothetical protein
LREKRTKKNSERMKKNLSKRMKNKKFKKKKKNCRNTENEIIKKIEIKEKRGERESKRYLALRDGYRCFEI